MTGNIRKRSMFAPLVLLLFLATFLGGCGAKRQIVISPLETPARGDTSLSSKKVAYVMTEADRYMQVTSEGGGGDKVSYFPYRDLEKAIRDALRAVYADVFAIKASSDSNAIQENDISFVFSPKIYTASDSESMFTWPPTQFYIDLSCKVTDPMGKIVSRIKVEGRGAAEYSEFKEDFGLAGRRAASDLSEKLKKEIIADPLLH